MFVHDIVHRYLDQLHCKRPESVKCQLKSVVRLLGEVEAEELRGHDLSDYRAKRRKEGVVDATVNRELAFLRAAFKLAHDEELIEHIPRFRLVKENNAREEFCVDEELYRILDHLPFHLQDLVEFLFWTGWRKGETCKLTWESVSEEMIVLKRQYVKNSETRILPIAGPIENIMARRRRARFPDAPWVFHMGDGRQIRDFRVRWAKACRKAGLPELHVHDLRRSLAHHHLQVGVPQAVTMKIAGWKTDSIYRRYAIVDINLLKRAIEDAGDYRAAALRLRDSK